MKKIPNSKDYYVSVDGFVWRDGRKLGGNRGAYQDVVISYVGGSTKRYYVHRLVAELYLPNPENKPQVNHKDGNKYNNCADNLEWCTPKENSQHAHRTGLAKNGIGSPNARLTEEQVHLICKMLAEGRRVKDVAELTGCCRSTVSFIRSKKYFKEISSKYTFPARQRTLSDETVRWICFKIVEGYSDGEIAKMLKHPKANYDWIANIRKRQSYKDISKEFNF